MRVALAVLAFVTACVPAATAQAFPARTDAFAPIESSGATRTPVSRSS